MKGTVIKITSRGEISKEEITSPPSLKFLQSSVGGFIESVPFFGKVVLGEDQSLRCRAFCNEEGKIRGLPYNEKATHLWYESMGETYESYPDILVGDVVIICGDEELLDQL